MGGVCGYRGLCAEGGRSPPSLRISQGAACGSAGLSFNARVAATSFRACTAAVPIGGRLISEEAVEGRLEGGPPTTRVGRKVLTARPAEVSPSALAGGSVSPTAFPTGGPFGPGSRGRVGNVALLAVCADGRRAAATKMGLSSPGRAAASLGPEAGRDALLASNEAAISRRAA